MDAVILQPTRLAVMAFLSGCRSAEFRAVASQCAVSDSALSKISSALEGAGYVRIRKGYVGKRPRTWLSLTDVGRKALSSHLTWLQQVAAEATRLSATADADDVTGADTGE
jgi:DNA-binding MarR family transcriptional regulator